MQVLIKISEEEYKKISNSNPSYADDFSIYYAVKNGTILPEKHGKLVDMSEVLIKLMQFYDGDKSIGQCLDEVNTIIEADGGDAE